MNYAGLFISLLPGVFVLLLIINTVRIIRNTLKYRSYGFLGAKKAMTDTERIRVNKYLGYNIFPFIILVIIIITSFIIGSQYPGLYKTCF